MFRVVVKQLSPPSPHQRPVIYQGLSSATRLSRLLYHYKAILLTLLNLCKADGIVLIKIGPQGKQMNPYDCPQTIKSVDSRQILL
jgi:hypothetical protein